MRALSPPGEADARPFPAKRLRPAVSIKEDSMAEPASGSNLGVTRLILVPSLITLAVTIVRLVGELQHWSPPFFNASAGGGAAVVGIVWLPIIFGPYFALKLEIGRASCR